MAQLNRSLVCAVPVCTSLLCSIRRMYHHFPHGCNPDISTQLSKPSFMMGWHVQSDERQLELVKEPQHVGAQHIMRPIVCTSANVCTWHLVSAFVSSTFIQLDYVWSVTAGSSCKHLQVHSAACVDALILASLRLHPLVTAQTICCIPAVCQLAQSPECCSVVTQGAKQCKD